MSNLEIALDRFANVLIHMAARTAAIRDGVGFSRLSDRKTYNI